MTAVEIGAANLVMMVGSILQGSVGFGLALFAAPLLALIDSALAPGPLLVANVILTAFMARREWGAVRFGDLGWSLGGRLVGIAVAVTVMAGLSPVGLDLLFGGIVLLAVVITALGLSFSLTPGTLLGAGLASGIMGTATAIGGPPMAIVYAREKGPLFRGTLSLYFTIGAVMSLTGLALNARFGWLDLWTGLRLAPGVVLGYLISGRFIGVIDRRGVRPAVLTVSALSAVVLMARHLL